jgi:hypothetical protein
VLTHCLTRRHDAVYALEERFCDVLKALSNIILTSKKAKERNEAIGLEKALENFKFVLLLVIQCHVLKYVNVVSKSLQTESLDILQAYALLSDAVMNVAELRCSFEKMIEEATAVCAKWGIQPHFSQKRLRNTKNTLTNCQRINASLTRRNSLRCRYFFRLLTHYVPSSIRGLKG